MNGNNGFNDDDDDDDDEIGPVQAGNYAFMPPTGGLTHPGDMGYGSFLPPPPPGIPFPPAPMLGPPPPRPPIPWGPPPPLAWPPPPMPGGYPGFPPPWATAPQAPSFAPGYDGAGYGDAFGKGGKGYPAPWQPLPFTGPPAPEAIRRQDPYYANTGPPLHPLDSTAREARTVYVGNIPSSLTEEQLMEWFMCIERPIKVKLCGDGTKPTQFAFVEFPSVASAHAAIGITGTECCGLPVKVSQARGTIQTTGGTADGAPLSPEEQEIRARTVYINQLDAALTEPHLREWFGERCGVVRQIKLCGDQQQTTRYCFIEFETLDGANACKALAGSFLGNFQIKCADSKVSLSKPIGGELVASGQQSRTVHVANLDRSITENDLKAYFEQCGPVSHVYIVAGEPHQPVRYGFVEFFDVNSAARAYGLSGAVIGQYGIRVSQAKGVITNSTPKPAAVLPGTTATPNAATQEAMNAAYAAALQAENLKYQQYMARKQESKGSGSDSDDSRKRKRKRRRRSRSSSSDRGRRRRKRSRSRSKGH